MYGGWGPYVSAAEKRRRAEAEMARLRKKGHPVAPVAIDGRLIARTFWGKAWCDNLEAYSDFATRLPRGRTYVRNGSVIDLQIAPGEVTALVSGTEIYKVNVTVAPVPPPRWKTIRTGCAGAIDSLVELLQGRLSDAVMTRICARDTGLFPSPKEIALRCSCPDWATMCKHVAAVLYGVGARLDSKPELLFSLRKVDAQDLIAQASADRTRKAPAKSRVLTGTDLSSLFGLDIAASVEPPKKKPAPARARSPKPRRRLP